MSFPYTPSRVEKCPDCGRKTVQRFTFLKGGIPAMGLVLRKTEDVERERQQSMERWRKLGQYGDGEHIDDHVLLKKLVSANWTAWASGAAVVDSAPHRVMLGHGQALQQTDARNCMICFFATPLGQAYANFLNSLP